MLEDWLSPLIEEKLILGLAWLETLGVDVHSHIYEDDGSNLRIKVALDLTSAGVVQILEFLTHEDPLQVILSDSQTQIRAKISTAATAAFLHQHRRPLTEKSEGGLINIHNFEIVATNLGPSDEQVSLLITEFDLVQSGFPSESDHPKHVHERAHVAKFLEDLDIMRKQQTPPTPKPAANAETVRRSQGMRALQTSQQVRLEERHIEEHGNETASMSQTSFATQLPKESRPAQTPSSDIRLQDAVSLSRPTAAGRSLQATDGNARANQIPPELSDLLNRTYNPTRVGRPPSMVSKTTAAAASISRPTTSTGDSDDVVGSTKANDKQTATDETSAPDVQSRGTEGERSSECEVDAEPAVAEQLLAQSGPQADHDREDVQDQKFDQEDQARSTERSQNQGLKGARQGAATRPSPAQFFRRHTAGESRTPLVGITRLICKIPKDQAELLEKPFSWYPGETGRASSFTNVPVAVLSELTSRLDKKSVQSTPPRASVLINVDYANATHQSEQDCESENDSSAADEPESASKSSELNNNILEDEDVPISWDSSSAREKLPPDSSMPETVSSTEAAALIGSRRVVPVLKPQARGSSSPDDEGDVASKESPENASDIEMSVPRALYDLARKKSSMSDAPSQSRVMRESKVQVAETPYAANRGQTHEAPRVRHSRRDVARSPARLSSTVIANTLEISNSAPHDGVHSTANPDITMSDYMRSDSDEQMLSQQLQHEMDAASQRSSLHSPIKPASPVSSALPQSSAVGNPLALRTSPFKLQYVPAFLPERFETSSAGAGSVSGKRGAEDRSPLERQAKKSRRPARDFGFSQDEPVLQDPAITTRQTRREFLSRNLSASLDTEPSLDQSTRTAATEEPAGRTGSTEMFDAHEMSSEDSSHSATSDRVLTKRLQELDSVSKNNHRAPHEVRRSADSLTSGAHQDEGTRFIVADVQNHERQPKLPVLQTSPDRASSSLVQQSLSGSTGLFQAFKAAYPDYQGDLKHFVGLCRRIDQLQKAQQMEHRALWDSFVIRHKTDYEPYLLQCMAEVENPLPYEVYFKNEIEDLLHNKKILTPTTLAAALREGSEATASSAVSPQILAQPADYSSRRTNRDRSPNLSNFPYRSPHSESRTPRSRDDEEANRNRYQQPWLVADRYRSIYSAREDPERLRGSSAFEENREVRLATAVKNGPEPTHAKHASGRRSPEKNLGGRQSVNKAKEEPSTVLTGGQERFVDTPRKKKSNAQPHSVQPSTGPIASTAPPQLTASSRSSGVSTSSRRPLPWEQGGGDGRSNPPASNVKKPVTSAQSVFKPPPSSMKPPFPVPLIPSNNLPPRPSPASTSAAETHWPPDPEARAAGKAPRASLPAGGRPDSSSIEGRNDRRKTLGGTPSSSTASGGPKKGVRGLSMWSTLNQAKAKGK